MEANPGKFKLPAGDLQERKVFVQRMREAVQVKRVSDGVRRVGVSFYSLMLSLSVGNEGPYGQPGSRSLDGEE